MRIKKTKKSYMLFFIREWFSVSFFVLSPPFSHLKTTEFLKNLHAINNSLIGAMNDRFGAIKGQF